MNKMEVSEIKGVEILKAGKWNGIQVTEKDLDQMVENFKDKVIEPYLNLNHDDKFTDKVKNTLSVVALGFVSTLKREGSSLIADFVQVPRKIAELIKAGSLKKRSVEFFKKGFRLNDKVYDNVLKAVSFFGADLPAVNNLSNDFEVLLKSKSHLITLTDMESKPETINFKEELIMDKIEVSKSEYDELVSFKSKAEKAEIDLTNLKKEKDEIEVKLKDLEGKEAELKELKADIEKKQAEAIEKEAETFINKVIDDGKLLPKFKADKVADYIEKSKDEGKLKLFKEDMESRDKVIELGELKNDEKPGTNLKSEDEMTPDEVNEAIEAKMKETGKSYNEIAVDFGINV
jgi:hypothetical protein